MNDFVLSNLIISVIAILNSGLTATLITYRSLRTIEQINCNKDNKNRKNRKEEVNQNDL